MLLQLAFVLIAIIIGARIGGIGLGVLGGLGLGILTFGFGLQPTSPPIDVMLMIVAVIAAASCMQAAGGLDLMVKWAGKIASQESSTNHDIKPARHLFVYLHSRNGACGLFGPSGNRRGCYGNEDPSRTSDGDRRDRFSASYYR